MRILVACEFSGIVRDAFIRKGHDAMSCDLVDSETPGPHYKGDVFDILYSGWDMMIAFPPCTHLAASGARWWKNKKQEQYDAINFVKQLCYSCIDKICIENPIGILSRVLYKPDQIIQPWQFGYGYTKATCLWLHNLPLLKPTNIVTGRSNRIHWMPDSSYRRKERSRTCLGIAEAMAEQWG